LLKIDVQGYEDAVLRGAVESLQSIDYVLVEVTYERFYDSEPLFDEVYQFLQACGFAFGGSWEDLLARDGRVLQSDALFLRQR
jgi:hypothetical protein